MAKQDRIELRIDTAFKGQLVEAAEAFGMNLSNFLIAAAQEQIARAQLRSKTLVLSGHDRERFLDALDRPARPAPEAIRKAKDRHEQQIIDD